MKAPEARQPGGGSTTTPRAAARAAFSKWTKDSAASSCSAPSTGLRGVAVKRALSVLFDTAAGRVDPCPRSSVKGWAKVRLLTAPEARLSSPSTSWGDRAVCSPAARLVASPCVNVEDASTHGPPAGLSPAECNSSSPRCSCAVISPVSFAPERAARLTGT